MKNVVNSAFAKELPLPVRPYRWLIWLLTLATGLGLCRSTLAQGADRDQLLRLVPADVGLCLVVQDLRGQAERLGKAPWFQDLLQTPLSKALAQSPEFQRLIRFEADFKKTLGFDFAQLQADILGNVVVFAYRPAPAGKPDEEQGLFLLRAHDAGKLRQLIDRLNALQKDLGEIKELASLDHQGVTYHRRVDRQGTHFYFNQGPFLAYTNSEGLLRQLIEQSRNPGVDSANSTLIRQLQKAGADKALACLWLNPRTYEGEMQNKARGKGPEALVLRTLLTYWQAMDAVVVTLKLDPLLEAAVTLQVRSADFPEAGRKLLLEPAEPAEIWKRLPVNSLVSLAGRVDALAWMNLLEQFVQPGQGPPMADSIRKSLGAALGLDPIREVLPNLGPDWGLSIAPATDNAWPHALFALGVRPGSGEVGVDQALVKGLQFFAGLAVFEYNRTHPEPFRVKSVIRDNVEIRYLVNDKVLPAGFQPAFALKDGYLLLATTPEAISQFRLRDISLPRGESPLFRLSPPEISRFLGQHRDLAIELLTERNKLSADQASRLLEGTRAMLDLFARVSLVRRTEDDLVSWILRVAPAENRKSQLQN